MNSLGCLRSSYLYMNIGDTPSIEDPQANWAIIILHPSTTAP